MTIREGTGLPLVLIVRREVECVQVRTILNGHGHARSTVWVTVNVVIHRIPQGSDFRGRGIVPELIFDKRGILLGIRKRV